MNRLFAVAGLVLSVVHCAHGPAVSSDLPIERVVVYRNGVAYFERAGTVSDERVEFQVKPEHVGDFLATLSVVERGGSSVKSASFPIGLDEDTSSAGEPPSGSLKSVVLELDGRKHDLRVGYISAQPVWKPSYRLVFEKGKPTLQAWGIVQNVSGEDWSRVRLSLVAGAPIAFESTLATPVTPRRPVVTDSGEVITAVPRAASTVAQRAAQPAPEAAPPSARSRRPSGGKGAPAPMAPEMSMPQDAEMAPGDEADVSSSPRKALLLAGVEVQAGATRYDVPEPVTVPNESATMVLLVSKEVPGESVFMFSPDGGVPDSARHPFRVVRFTNDTRGLLERGPIAVIDSGAFLGQGVLEPLASGGEATVPFALERAVAVDRDQRHDQQSARLAKIEAGSLFIERDQVQRTSYRVRNGQATATRLVVRHPRSHGMRLHMPPKGTHDVVGQSYALVPVEVPATATAELVVDERRAFTTPTDWLTQEADDAVKAYWAEPRADKALVTALKAAWELRTQLLDVREQRRKIEGERHIIRQAVADTRANLTALQKNPGTRVSELRERLASRLSELDKRNATLTEKATELDLRDNELRVRFEEKVRTLKLEQPLPPAAQS